MSVKKMNNKVKFLKILFINFNILAWCVMFYQVWKATEDGGKDGLFCAYYNKIGEMWTEFWLFLSILVFIIVFGIYLIISDNK